MCRFFQLGKEKKKADSAARLSQRITEPTRVLSLLSGDMWARFYTFMLNKEAARQTYDHRPNLGAGPVAQRSRATATNKLPPRPPQPGGRRSPLESPRSRRFSLLSAPLSAPVLSRR